LEGRILPELGGEADPEETNDLHAEDDADAQSMKEELLDALADADRPYQKR